MRRAPWPASGKALGEGAVNIEALQGTTLGGRSLRPFFPDSPDRASRALDAPAHDSHAAVDPVCRMHVKPETEAAHLLVRDTTHYFLLARLCPGSHREPRELCSVVKHRMMHRRPTAVWHRRTSRLLWHCNHPTDRHCLLAECMHVSVSAGPDDAARERRGRCGLWLRGAGT
jgi:hypothetical protein